LASICSCPPLWTDAGKGPTSAPSITYDIVTQQHVGNIAVDSNVSEYSEVRVGCRASR
jgi:hypothetical protein